MIDLSEWIRAKGSRELLWLLTIHRLSVCFSQDPSIFEVPAKQSATSGSLSVLSTICLSVCLSRFAFTSSQGSKLTFLATRKLLRVVIIWTRKLCVQLAISFSYFWTALNIAVWYGYNFLGLELGSAFSPPLAEDLLVPACFFLSFKDVHYFFRHCRDMDSESVLRGALTFPLPLLWTCWNIFETKIGIWY